MNPEPTPSTRLTRRELEVMQLVAEGLSNTRIGKRLDLSPHTIKFHVQHACRKLGDGNRVKAVVYAMRQGILQ